MALRDVEPAGRLLDVATSETMEKIYHMLMDGRRDRVRNIACIVAISTNRRLIILHTHLSMRKPFARWVPGLLTFDQNRDLAKCCKDGLELFQRIWRTLSVISSMGTKPGYTPILFRPKNNLSNRFTERNLHKNGDDRFSGRKGHGDCHLGFGRDNPHRLSRKG